MTKEIRDSFIFYRSFIDAIEDLPESQQLAVFKAISYFALNEDAPSNLEGFQKTIFRMAEPLLSANTKRYKNGKKGGSHGKKGGRPKKDEKPQNNPTGDLENNPKITPYKYYNENKNEKLEIIIPNFIDQILFDEFLQQRKKDKNPIEGLALKLTLEDLERWENKNKGNANLAIKNTIKGGWKSLVEPKTNDWTGKKLEIEDNFCLSLNQAIGQPLIKNLIEGDIITIKLTGASANDKWDALSQDLKDSILAKVKAKFGKETKISF